jgi:hypothetical protein
MFLRMVVIDVTNRAGLRNKTGALMLCCRLGDLRRRPKDPSLRLFLTQPLPYRNNRNSVRWGPTESFAGKILDGKCEVCEASHLFPVSYKELANLVIGIIGIIRAFKPVGMQSVNTARRCKPLIRRRLQCPRLIVYASEKVCYHVITYNTAACTARFLCCH